MIFVRDLRLLVLVPFTVLSPPAVSAAQDRDQVATSMEGMVVTAHPLATYAGQASQMKQWTEGAQINTDLNLRLQYLAGMSVNSFMGEELLGGILEHYQFPDNIFHGSPGRLAVVERELQAAGRGR